jgi:DNA polymerase III subunit epsilon
VKLLALVDTETTGLLDNEDAFPIEVAVARWSIDAGCVIDSWSQLLRAECNPCEEVNGIPVAALAFGVAAETCLYELNRRLLDVDVILAHNAPFDRGMLARIGGAADKPWVCTKSDIDWTRGKPGGSLVELAVAHHVTVASAHRALSDVMLMAGVLESVWHERGGLDGPDRIRALLARAMRPKVLVEALVPFDRKEEAKAARFSWNAPKKRWERSMAIEDLAGLPFKTRPVAS